MPLLKRMRSLYPWHHLVRKGQPTLATCKIVPQFNGIPGWLLLGHDEEEIPRVVWTDGKTEERLPIVMDERLCFDTIFRAVRLGPKQVVVCDVWVVNGEAVHGNMSYGKRQEVIETLLREFHRPDLTALVTTADAPANALLRGYECYDNELGSTGIFTETPPLVPEHLPAEE